MLWAFLRPSGVKLTEKDRKFTFQAIVKKGNRTINTGILR